MRGAKENRSEQVQLVQSLIKTIKERSQLNILTRFTREGHRQ